MVPTTATTRAPRRPAARKGHGSPGRFDVRPMYGADLKRVSELREAACCSADPRSFGLCRSISGARWAVAEAPGGHLAGIVGAVPLGETGILCHLAVHPDHRGRGLGTALSSWAVSYLRSWGVGTVRLYSTSQAERLHLSMGFEPVTHLGVFRLDGAAKERAATLCRSREATVHTADGQRVSRLSLKDLPELCGLDRRSCGADRAALILTTLKTYPGPGLVARNASDRISGYLLSSAAGGTISIGPFAAASPAIARALLARVLLATRADTRIEVVVPNPTGSPAQEVLEGLGFHHRRDRLLMELGEARTRTGFEQYGTTPYLAT